MKKKMPSEGLRLGRDSGSILCDTLKKWRFRTGWGGGLFTKKGGDIAAATFKINRNDFPF